MNMKLSKSISELSYLYCNCLNLCKRFSNCQKQYQNDITQEVENIKVSFAKKTKQKTNHSVATTEIKIVTNCKINNNIMKIFLKKLTTTV